MINPYLSSSSVQWLCPGLICVLFMACANPIPPTGGPKDTTPPNLIAEESTPNYLTNFDRKEIVLTFDEWVQLKDQNLQIVISPPLTKRHEVALKGKSVTIRFHEDEVLRDRTTYLINFGSAIADITEGNLLDQYKYVFSTGTFIDSLYVNGSVVSATTGKPEKQVLVILHDNLSDTAITKLLPAYFAKSDTAGRWTVENIRSDTFNVYTLVDLNLNYRFDQVGEKVGFLGQSIFLPDTSGTRYRLVLFEENPVISTLDVDRRKPGQTRIVLSAPSKHLSIESLDTTLTSPEWRLDKDTLIVWNATPDSLNIVIKDAVISLDTILLYPYSGAGAEANTLLASARLLHPLEAMTIRSKHPLDTFDRTLVRCYLSDTTLIENFTMWIDSAERRQLHIRHQWLEQDRYRLTLLPGAVSDIFGSVNDTLNMSFQISPANSYGQLYVDISGLNDSIQYVVELIHPQNGVIKEEIITGVVQTKLQFERLQPQTYQIRIVEDVNANGRWDTGNLTQQRQPERVSIFSLEPLRAGWDLESTLVWQQK